MSQKFYCIGNIIVDVENLLGYYSKGLYRTCSRKRKKLNICICWK